MRLLTERVDRLPVLPHLEEEVRSCAPPGTADPGDDVAPLDAFPDVDGVRREMRVGRREAVAVVEDHEHPVPRIHPVKITVPAAAARIGVPQGTAMSIPVWNSRVRKIGWIRQP